MSSVARIFEIFKRLKDLPPARQQQALNDLGQSEPEIVAEVQRKLAHLYASTGGAPTGPPGDGSSNAPAAAPQRASAIAARHGLIAAHGFPARFEQVAQLQSGGMGVIFTAFDTSTQRTVAIKVISPSLAGNVSAEYRLEEEARSGGKLEHRGIVPVYSISATRPPYIVMKFMEGGSLQAAIERKTVIPGREAATYIHAAAEAIAYAHSKGVIHRDIKPGNLLLDEHGAAHISDFGVARRVDNEKRHTMAGELVGTPAYMAPEQIEDGSEAGAAADIYSLGATLYHLLTGVRPFRADNWGAIKQLVLNQEPAPPRSITPGIDRDLETICLQCLSKSPANRYASATALAEDLARYLAGDSIVARPPRLLQRVYRKCRKRPWQALTAGLGALLLVLLVIAGVAATSVAITMTRLKNQADAGRAQAEEMRNVAELRQTQSQYQAAMHAIEDRSFALALQSLSVPTPGWETLHLRARTGLQPNRYDVAATGTYGVHAAAVSPDAKSAISVQGSGRMVIWNLRTGRIDRVVTPGRFSESKRRWLHHFEAGDALPVSPVTAVCWAPGGGMFYTADFSGALIMHNSVVGAAASGDAASSDAASSDAASAQVASAAAPLTALAGSGDLYLAGSQQGGLYLHNTTDHGWSQKIESEPAAGVTCIAALPAMWVVGREDGTLQTFSLKKLEPLGAFKVAGPVWALDAIAAPKSGFRIAAACGRPAVEMLHANADGKTLRSAGQFQAPASKPPATAMHTVAFGGENAQLYAIDDRGQLIAWQLAGGNRLWEVQATYPQPYASRFKQFETAHGGPLPLVFRRRSALLHVGDDGSLITAGADAAIKTWRRPQARQPRQVLNTMTGPKPQIVFGPSVRRGSIIVDFPQDSEEKVWALDQDGRLTVIEANTGGRLATRMVNPRIAPRPASNPQPAGGIVAIPGSTQYAGAVATTGGANGVQCWQLQRTSATRFEIAKLELPPLRHNTQLISLACSRDGVRLAAVDAKSKLVIWSLHTGQVEFTCDISSAGAATATPLTGRLAFNPAGDRLCAFGANQNAALFEAGPWRRLPDQVWIAGSGGVAVVWQPQDGSFLLAADDDPRYQPYDFRAAERLTAIRNPLLRAECAALRVTPGGGRIVSLERDGRLRFFDSRYLIELVELKSLLRRVNDLAFDPSGSMLAIAGDDGRLEIWRTQTAAVEPSEPPGVLPAFAPWKAHALLPPRTGAVFIAHSGPQFDAAGAVHLAYVESAPGDFRNEGALFYCNSRDGDHARQRLAIDRSEHDRRIDADGAGLTLETAAASTGRPAVTPRVVFRRRTAKPDTYDGEFYIARRNASGWKFRRILDTGNCGFYPFFRQTSDGGELLHFDFSGYYLKRSTPGKHATGNWDTRTTGLQGDGQRLTVATDKAGRLHAVFRRNRFNQDSNPLLYATYNGSWKYDPLSAGNRMTGANLLLHPDGAPVIVTAAKVVIRRNNKWVDYAPLPPDNKTTNMVFDRRGRLCAPHWNRATGVVSLQTFADNKWTTREIFRNPAPATAAAFLPGKGVSANRVLLCCDADGNLVVLAGRLFYPNSWLNLYRP